MKLVSYWQLIRKLLVTFETFTIKLKTPLTDPHNMSGCTHSRSKAALTVDDTTSHTCQIMYFSRLVLEYFAVKPLFQQKYGWYGSYEWF